MRCLPRRARGVWSVQVPHDAQEEGRWPESSDRSLDHTYGAAPQPRSRGAPNGLTIPRMIRRALSRAYLNNFRYAPVVRVFERPFSDLLRHPKDVTDELEDGDVLLRRRDEPDLRLSRADRDASRAEAFAGLGRALRNIAVHSPAVLGEALADAFPWVELLPTRDRQLFLDEFSRVLAAAAAIDDYAPVSQLVREWRATAEVHADPALARRLRRPLDASGDQVEVPVG
jgi:Family of unknown function (DUF6247)